MDTFHQLPALLVPKLEATVHHSVRRLPVQVLIDDVQGTQGITIRDSIGGSERCVHRSRGWRIAAWARLWSHCHRVNAAPTACLRRRQQARGATVDSQHRRSQAGSDHASNGSRQPHPLSNSVEAPGCSWKQFGEEQGTHQGTNGIEPIARNGDEFVCGWWSASTWISWIERRKVRTQSTSCMNRKTNQHTMGSTSINCQQEFIKLR
mmetsp:Transcript_21846/g.62254  ORF Transcript_21846/g.62254 Transcript_21846/m.62254 type:complete len:207 (-) Transcript_21846:58-678(-)